MSTGAARSNDCPSRLGQCSILVELLNEFIAKANICGGAQPAGMALDQIGDLAQVVLLGMDQQGWDAHGPWRSPASSYGWM